MKKLKIFEIRNFKRFIPFSKMIVVLFILAAAGLARAADGDVDQTFQGSALRLGAVYTTAVQPDGKILIGGDFYAVNGVPRRALARLNVDGTLDTAFQTNLQGIVYSLQIQPDGKILVGGAVLLNLPTRQRLNFFRLNADGTSDDAFNAGEGVAGGTVYTSVLQPDGKILIGGNFDGLNGFFRSGIFRINADGTRDTSFSASAYGDDANEGIYGIALQADGKIAIAGDFKYVNDIQRIGVARLNSDGTTDTSFNGGITSTNRRVWGLALQPDNKIIIGGFFNQINGVTKNKIARFNADGSLDTSFAADIPTALYTVRTVRLQADGRILVGGFFAQINGTPKNNIARLFSNGTLDTSFTAVTDTTVYDIIPSDNPIIAGGFTKFNNTDSFGVSRADNSGNRDNNFSVGVGTVGIVRKVVTQPDGKLIVGGEFTHFANSSRKNIARLNNDSTLDDSFNPGTGFETGSRVNDVALLSSSKIAVVGNFNTFNGATQRMIVVLNADGSRDTTFTPNFTQTGEIRKVVPFVGGKILILGSFRFGSDTQSPGFALLNTDGSRDTSFTPTFAPSAGNINSMAVQPDGKIIVVGSFMSVNGTAKNYIARLNADGSLDNTLTLNTVNYNQSSISDVYVYADGKILISGNFQRNDSQTFASSGLLRLNPDGGRDLSFNPPYGRFIGGSFTVQPDGRILALMSYTFEYAYFSPVTKTFVVRLRTNGTLDYAYKFNFRGIYPNNAQSIYTMAIFPDNKVIIGGDFPAYTGTSRISLARLENSMSPNAVFDFDGDGKTDISIFRPSVGEWWLNRSSSGQTVAAQFGSPTDKPVPADFTGDGKTDIAFWRGSTGEWFILRSEDGSYYSFPFGTTGDVPVVGDFDADGKVDPAVFRPSNSTWYISKSSGGTIITTFGSTGDIPVPADYDGDDKTDIAIYRPSSGQWWLYRSSQGIIAATFGTATDKPVPGDYSGDSRADIAFWRPSTGEWFILRSEDGSFYSVPFGTNGDIPAPGDYDGDGFFDIAVYRPADSTWYINRSSAGILITGFGASGDRPIPGTFVP
jgi:uncharacterized delta-60 repeat protein